MVFESFDVVFYTCIFLLPGYIIKSVVDILVPPTKYNEAKYFLSCLLYSTINCAVWSWVYKFVIQYIKYNTIWYWVLLLSITIIGATILALVIGVVKQKEILESLFKKVKINKINPIPTAWDYFFSKQRPSWVIVTLKSGKIVYGYYSTESFASSAGDERDLYIEKTYMVDEKMNWVEDSKSQGILIVKEEIETIEFME